MYVIFRNFIANCYIFNITITYDFPLFEFPYVKLRNKI